MVLDSTAKVSVPRCDLERELVETMLTKHLLTKTLDKICKSGPVRESLKTVIEGRSR